MPEYTQEENQINKIALYPLFYGDDGKEERLFGLVFTNMFFSDVASMAYKKPLEMIPPDATVQLFEENGVTVENMMTGIVDRSDTVTEYPVCKRLMPADLKAISDGADALLFCDLISYNEVGAGEELGQAVATACLTLGMASASENNLVSMKLSLFSTETGTVLWEYGAYFTKSMSGRENTRSDFTASIANGYLKYFPLSTEFKSK
ncbi:hypothetical protein JXJ21_14105 [candidate division KSB1 bacterium]|nr:hypothetical protein [candidate division KSB1 bacterium]